MAREVEIASPLCFNDITCLCRVSKNGMVAECFLCGVVMHGGVHLCEVAYGGFFCSRCCPACNGKVLLTPEEVAAMEANRRGLRHGVVDDAKWGRGRDAATNNADLRPGDEGFVCGNTDDATATRWREYAKLHPV